MQSRRVVFRRAADYYGAAHRIFSSDDASPAERQAQIARAFWNMLEEPDDVEDYADVLQHTAAGARIRFGVKDGEPFWREGR